MNTPCSGGACVTCSDEAVPARVLALLPGGLALVGRLDPGAQDTGIQATGIQATGIQATGIQATGIQEGGRDVGVQDARSRDAGAEEVSVALVEARVGTTVLVHAGEAIAVIGDAGD